MEHLNLASLACVVWIAASCGGSTFTSSETTAHSTGGQAATGGAGNQGGVPETGGDQSSGGDTSVPPTSGTGGIAGMTCDQLASAYLTDLAVAKQCSANSTSNPCTTTVEASLPCGCPTFVNTSRTAAIANLNKYMDAWSAQNCVANCPAIACVAPPAASCSSSGSGGTTRCVDNAHGPN